MVRSRVRKGDGMITINSLDVNGIIFTGIQLELPNTTFFIITNDIGYIMSTSLSGHEVSKQWEDGQTMAGIVFHAQSIEDLLLARLDIVTNYARQSGWIEGMRGKEALLKIA